MCNYVFLTNYYLPMPGATGMCVHQVAKELAKQNNVFTVCYEDGDDTKTIDQVKIIKIKIPAYLKDNATINESLRIIHYLESLTRKLVHIRNYPLRSTGLLHKYIKVVQQIIEKYGEITIVASFTPIEAVIAAYKLKLKYPKKVKIAYYSTDTLSNEQGDSGLLPAAYREKCGMRWEKRLFSVYDRIFIMECHRYHYFTEEYKDFQDKMHIVNFPLFTRMENCAVKKKHQDLLNFVYAGTFYRVLRNPKFLCDCLLKLSQDKTIEVNILGSGDCNDIIEKAVLDSEGVIKFHGMQPHNIVIEYLSSADILLSVGNAESPMATSKIYEYMSTGKPIIHTYTYDRDPCIEPLKKYGNALLVKEGDGNAVLKIKRFIEISKTLNYEEVEKTFITSTPKYTADILENL